MQLAADVSLYPLHQDFIPPIDAIIARFESYPEIRVERNRLSTQLFGDYEDVMEILKVEMATAFREHKAVLVVKFACLDAGAPTPE